MQEAGHRLGRNPTTPLKPSYWPVEPQVTSQSSTGNENSRPQLCPSQRGVVVEFGTLQVPGGSSLSFN